MLSGESIICFGGEDWWYHHPHWKNHLMRRFARAGNRVVFVNSISMGLPGLGNKDLVPRVVRKLRSYAKLARGTKSLFPSPGSPIEMEFTKTTRFPARANRRIR